MENKNVTNETTTQAFYLEGENIIGYALYFDYEDNETAKSMYDTYRSIYEEQEDVKKFLIIKIIL